MQNSVVALPKDIMVVAAHEISLRVPLALTAALEEFNKEPNFRPRFSTPHNTKTEHRMMFGFCLVLPAIVMV